MSNNTFNAHHSPWGAYMSLILGHPGAEGGIASNTAYSPKESVYIGYTREREGTQILPFASLKRNDFEEAFGIEKSMEEKASKVSLFEAADISRTYNIGTDCFAAKDLCCKIYSPYRTVPKLAELTLEEQRIFLLPAVILEISLDNTNSKEPATLFFGLSGLRRLFGDGCNHLVGGAMGTRVGFAAATESGAVEAIGVNLLKQLTVHKPLMYRLGNEVIVSIEVAPGTKETLTFAVGAYENGIMTSGIETHYAYSECFENLEEVLTYALKHQEEIKAQACHNDLLLGNTDMNKARQFLNAHSLHSYLACTQLLKEKDGSYLWVVNEGEYAMMNTLDLTIDQMFFELKHHPWTVKNNLELFIRRYHYYDEIKDQQGSVKNGGLSFCHDMGVANMFSMAGASSYEMPQANGCFGYMTMEQLLNFTIISTTYALLEKDFTWLRAQQSLLIELLTSIVKRDGNNDGIMDLDSTRCGEGHEITTYDSLDASLGQARNNLYIAVKTWGALYCLKGVFDVMGLKDESQIAQQQALLLARHLPRFFSQEQGSFKAVLEGEEHAYIIPAIEGLVYPWYVGLFEQAMLQPDNQLFLELLKQHLKSVLVKGKCLSSENGGWKISSSNDNTWMSKVFISQHVAKEILELEGAQDTTEADEAHMTWQQEGCGKFCAVDQVNARTGQPIGSRLYPRLVTSFLWHQENSKKEGIKK